MKVTLAVVHHWLRCQLERACVLARRVGRGYTAARFQEYLIKVYRCARSGGTARSRLFKGPLTLSSSKVK